MKRTANLLKNSKLLQIQVSLSLLLMVISCNFSDPSVETLANYNFRYLNDNQVSVGGEYLKDSIYVQVISYLTPTDVSGFSVEFKVTKGGGKVDQQVVKTKKNGKAATRWKLGTDSFSQIVTARVTDPEGNVFPGSQIVAHGILHNAWNEVDYSPINEINDLVSDTITKQSWVVSSCLIYKLGTNFLDWQGLASQQFNCPKSIEIDKNGIIYIGNWHGELFKSMDHGLTWEKCTKPIPNRSYFFNLWITADCDLWATSYEDGLWHSKDGGLTWSNPAQGKDKNTLINGIFRMKNNWLVSLGTSSGQGLSVMKSEDEGKTWTALNTPTYPYSFFVTENDEIIVFTQNDAGIYKSTDLGKTYKQMFSASVTFSTGSPESYVRKFGADYFIDVPGYGVLKTKNFENFETLFNEPNVNELYIDHFGSLYAKGTMEKSRNTFVFNHQ